MDPSANSIWRFYTIPLASPTCLRATANPASRPNLICLAGFELAVELRPTRQPGRRLSPGGNRPRHRCPVENFVDDRYRPCNPAAADDQRAYFRSEERRV